MQAKTKRLILIRICWSLAVLLFAAGGWFLYQWFQYTSYKDAQYHFSIRYPKSWEKVEHFQGSAVIFVRPKESALERVAANVNISVQDVPDRIATLKSFSETITMQMKAVYKKSIVIVEDKDFTFAGRKGHRLILQSPKPDNLQLMFVWTVKGQLAYIFTFLATQKQYQQLLPIVEQMVNSFQFIS